MEQTQFIKEVLPFRERLVVYAGQMMGSRNDAEDVVQELYCTLWGMRDELSNYKSIFALSVTITKRLCINRLKSKRRKEKDLKGGIWIDGACTPDSRLEQKDQMMHVMRIVERLPDMQQAILRMRHIDGLETEEMAAITGCTPEAIRMNLSRARKRVKEVFIKTIDHETRV